MFSKPCAKIRFLEMKQATKDVTRMLKYLIRGVVTNYVDKFLSFVDHLPTYVDIFYLINVDKKSTFLDYLPTSSCQHSL